MSEEFVAFTEQAELLHVSISRLVIPDVKNLSICICVSQIINLGVIKQTT